MSMRSISNKRESTACEGLCIMHLYGTNTCVIYRKITEGENLKAL